MNDYLKSLAKIVVDNNIPIVGQKVWYGESFYWANIFSKMLHRMTPGVLVMDGGPHPSVYREDYARESNADIVVYSEGEYVLAEILSMTLKEKLSKKQILMEIKNRELPNIIINSTDFAYHGNLSIQDINKKTVQVQEGGFLDNSLRLAVVNDALGCPYNMCSFCNYKHIYPQYYKKSTKLIADEIESLVKSGIGLFRFSSGSNKLNDALLLANEIMARGLFIHYSFFNRVEKNAAENYDKIVDKYKTVIKSGLRAVFLGAESGNEQVLNTIMNKGLKCSDISFTIQAIREAAAANGVHVDIALSIIYPHPTPENISLDTCYEDTAKLIRMVMPDSVLVNPPAPFKDAPWLQESRFGFGYISRERTSREEEIQKIIHTMLHLDYKAYLPPSMWDHPPIALQGIDAKGILELNTKMRKYVTSLGIANDLGDDSFLILRAAGYIGKQGVHEFRKDATIAIMSCHYKNVEEIFRKVNEYSTRLAASSVLHDSRQHKSN